MEPVWAFRLGSGRAQQRKNGFWQHFYLGENYSSSPCPEANQFSSSWESLVPFQLPPQHWSPEELSPSMVPLRGMPGIPVATISTGFQRQVMGTSLPKTRNPLCLRGDLNNRDTPPNLYLPLVCIGPAHSISSPPTSWCGFFCMSLVIGVLSS